MMDTVLNLGSERRHRRRPRRGGRRPALRLGFLSPLHPDVRLGGARRRSPSVRGDHRAHQAGYRRDRGHRSSPRRTGTGSPTSYKDMIEAETGKPFPQDPEEQLWGAIGAVFGSWMNPRANTYRKLHDIPAEWGTAVNVQTMVFGNMGNDCATGVCFTRDPSTGREHVLRRVPGERPGRGRGGRHPHAAAAVQGAAPSPTRSRWRWRCRRPTPN